MSTADNPQDIVYDDSGFGLDPAYALLRYPNALAARLGPDYVQVYFVKDSGETSDAFKVENSFPVFRLYGELVFDVTNVVPKIITSGTLSFLNDVTPGSGVGTADLASFKSGLTEKFRINSDGSVFSGAGTFKAISEGIYTTVTLVGEDVVFCTGSSPTEAIRIHGDGIFQSSAGIIQAKGEDYVLLSLEGAGLSFTTGEEPEDERFHVDSDGNLQTATGLLRGSSFGSSPAYTNITLEGEELCFRTGPDSGDEKLYVDDEGSIRTSNGHIKALTFGETPSYTDISLEADELNLALWDGSSSVDWGRFYIDGFNTAFQQVYHPFWIRVVDDEEEYKSMVVVCCDLTIILKCPNADISIVDASDDTRIEMTVGGTVTTIAPQNYAALLALDSYTDNTDYGKKWVIRSAITANAGCLQFVNDTDTGDPTVEMTPNGSVYAAEYVGTGTVTDAPDDEDGRVGAMVVDTTNKKLWVKVTNSGQGRWWHAALSNS